MKKDPNKRSQKQVTEWNRSYPEGTTVAYYSYLGAKTYTEYKTRSGAFYAHSGTPVIFLEGKAGYVALEHVRPIVCIHHQRSRLSLDIKQAIDAFDKEAERIGLRLKYSFGLGNEACICATGKPQTIAKVS